MPNEKNLFETLNDYIKRNIDPKVKEDEIWNRFGREVAVLILDSSGFSRTTKELGIIHFLTRLAHLRNIVIPIIEKKKCISHRTEADNIMAEFDTVDQALNVVIEAKLAIKEHGLMLTETQPYQIAVGIGFGKLLFSETLEGYYGEEMNLASKLGEDTAKGGEILITESAFQTITLKDQFQFEKRLLKIAGVSIPHFNVVSI
jgi:adenylate cyclase